MYRSDYSLLHHGVGHLHETGDIGALHVVEIAVGLHAILLALRVNLSHDLMEFGVDFCSGPLQMLGIDVYKRQPVDVADVVAILIFANL